MNDLLMPVQSPAGFFGHRDLVRRIFSRIGAERPQSIAVIGSRKSGKSSLLNYPADHTVRDQYLENSSQYRFFKITAEVYAGSGAGDFIRNALMRITDQTVPDGGRIIRTIGDSIMASFEEARQSVVCAVAMQKRLKKHNSAVADQERILVRMGLHYGEAVVDEKDLFGDMVNTSARVEAGADAGEILISSRLREQIDASAFPLICPGEAAPHFEYILETLPETERGVLKAITGGLTVASDIPAETLERKGYIMRRPDDSLQIFAGEFGVFAGKHL